MTAYSIMDTTYSPSSNGRAIAFASAKGGTGKTVLAASTAWTLLRSSKSVLVIDGDFSTRGLSLFILGNIIHTSDLVVRDEECLAEYFLSELSPEDLRPRQILRHGVEYHIIFSNTTLWRSGVPEQAILSDMRLEPEKYLSGLRKVLEHFRRHYDYIIIDTRGGYDFTSAIPPLLSDTHIIVLEPDRISLEQIQGYEKAVTEFAEKHDLRIPLRGFLVNKASFDPSGSTFVEHLTRTYSIKTYGVIPADISCIRAYEDTESPMVRFPHSDFAYWCIRAIDGFVAPSVNWKDKKSIEDFQELRRNIGREWAGRKRTEKIISWLPFAQLAPIVIAIASYFVYSVVPSWPALLVSYSAIALFIIWSMVGSAMSGLDWLRWRGVSLPSRSIVASVSVLFILGIAALMVFDVPRKFLLVSAPPQVIAAGREATVQTEVLVRQALDSVDAWKQAALDTIDHSEREINTNVEALVRKELGGSAANGELGETDKRLVVVYTRQVQDRARDLVRDAALGIETAIRDQGARAVDVIGTVVSALEKPRSGITLIEQSKGVGPPRIQYPSVFDIIDEATRATWANQVQQPGTRTLTSPDVVREGRMRDVSVTIVPDGNGGGTYTVRFLWTGSGGTWSGNQIATVQFVDRGRVPVQTDRIPIDRRGCFYGGGNLQTKSGRLSVDPRVIAGIEVSLSEVTNRTEGPC